MKKFYITTPIYYVNDVPHIGHAYTTVAADVLARFKRLCGFEVHFLTGTDEHGPKIAKSAEDRGKSPQALADEVVLNFKNLWKKLFISNDDFIRTTEERHIKGVIRLFEKVHQRGYIYEGHYEGWYCTPDESFWTEKQLQDGKCPSCGRPVERLKEESYFFQMSVFQEPLIKHIEANPDFIQPISRRNEIVSRLKEGLEDLCISRSTTTWGIPVPRDKTRGRILYVWFDALANYLTAVGYGGDEEAIERYWPADLHLVGKDILWFHTVIWPAILMAAELSLPRRVFAHGWWTSEGQKMSKSRGNVVDPFEVIETYGADAFRYFLMREVPFGLDGDYSRIAMVNRINNELANDLGNLLSRTLAMIERYFEGVVPEPGPSGPQEDSLKGMALQAHQAVMDAVDALQFSVALEEIFSFIRRANKYVEETQPWALAKSASPRLSTVLYSLAEALRIIALFLYPFIPVSASEMWSQVGLGNDLAGQSFSSVAQWGLLKPGTRVKKGKVLFPKVNL